MAASAIFAFERFRLLFERGNLEDQPGYGTRKWHTNFAGMLAYEKRLQQPAIWDDDIAAKKPAQTALRSLHTRACKGVFGGHD